MDVRYLWVVVLSLLIRKIFGAIIKDPETCTDYPCLIFDENFDTFDLKTWRHTVSAAATGNFEFQYYTNNRSNSFVEEGVLNLKATLTNDTFSNDFLTSGTLDLWAGDRCTANRNNAGCYRKESKEAIINPVQSASITTEKSFAFTFGKLEVSAKMPVGDWLWPAIWLMPKYDEYGSWPSSGEIDLLESRGNPNLINNDDAKTQVGNKRVMQSLHWGPFYPLNGQPYTLAKTNKRHGSFSDSFHKYTLDWTPESLVFFIDSKCTLNVTMKDQNFWEMGKFPNQLNNPWRHGSNLAPFDKDFYIILNLAVGGTNDYFHRTYQPSIPWNNDKNEEAKTDFWNARDQWLSTWTDPTLQIDYVKVWKTKKN